jgi:glycerol-3-phosphate acyltransferase PlsX
VSKRPITVALDAMGGDSAPAEPVGGAVLAARGGIRVLVVGDEAGVRDALAQYDTAGLPIEVVPSRGVVSEGENPVRALRSNPDASIAIAAGLVQQGLADASVSMGSTGATMAASVLTLGVFDGLDRPALGGPFIALAPRMSVIDLGSQIDCRPSQLLSFAALGVAFSRTFLAIDDPRIALLSVGSEAGKGNKLVQETYPLLERSGLHFIGNIEGHELLADKAEVVVCDGFVGNVLLKYTEGLAAAVAHHLALTLGADSPAVAAIRGLAGNAEHAGGPLLGVNGVVVIGHGRSPATHVANAITRARDMIQRDVVNAMRNELASVLARAEGVRDA